jgi:hypothetical protein
MRLGDASKLVRTLKGLHLHMSKDWIEISVGVVFHWRA